MRVIDAFIESWTWKRLDSCAQLLAIDGAKFRAVNSNNNYYNAETPK